MSFSLEKLFPADSTITGIVVIILSAI